LNLFNFFSVNPQNLKISDCEGGLNSIGRWKATPGGLQLLSASGDMVVWLKEQNGVYQGQRLSDGQKLALDR